ncbi:16S rRNA (cytosine(967)-C(5))-methyltransferase RsmB [Anaerovorax odorimutans]|uniref:16S rRNA (cytosine(967)-C(5))-methyltransferase RsmB n=1 Tax=Anaerovorax odorimutans TaxID=109327 RepID=UPI000406BF39|nr:16S rRNA (cytosine(967)-C(5))-methyltransferase RsmB [Anaerovorax odorimutans]
MDVNRKTAYFTLMDVEEKKSYSNLALNHHIICGKPDSVAFVRELVYGVLENKIYLDYIISKFVNTPVDKMRSRDLTILRMGIYQLGFMDSVPEYAAVNESVVIAKRFCKGREGFINGVLRSYIRSKDSIELPDRNAGEIEYLSTKYSYEAWIIELWLEQYNVDFVEKLLKSGNETPDLVIRVNNLKTNKEDLKNKLLAKDYSVKDGALCSEALHVKGSGLLKDNLYKNGMFSVQDESSMLAVEMLDPKPNDLVMDVCAAPGGKTLFIAEKMNNKGIIKACDIYKRKLGIIDKESERLGITIIETKTWDASKIDSSMVDKADKVLVDAPCSGLGVIRRKPEIKYKKRNDNTKELPIKQLDILCASSKYVKPGGILVYSTCTISLYENQRVISDFLRKNPSFEKIEILQLFPNINNSDGFFICKMQKENSIISKDRATL